MLDDLPVLGVCGWSGSGKTTLIERVLPPLVTRGLKVAVLKHATHPIQTDVAGKDSDRLFLAGADVWVQAPGEDLGRRRLEGLDALATLRALAGRYDLVLVEGGKGLPIPKVWLQEGPAPGPSDLEGLLATIPCDADRPAALLGILEPFVQRQWLKTPLYACVLIGGKSARMGRPKHLLARDGGTWLERTVGLLRAKSRTLAVIGEGQVPDSLAGCVRLADAPDARGPMAGILAAMRWAPRASWLVAACDLPRLSAEALDWLLSTRGPGRWATVPRLEGSGGIEPLLAHYDFRARSVLEGLAAEGDFALQGLLPHRSIHAPSPPEDLAGAWRNVNTPQDLAEEGASGSADR